MKRYLHLLAVIWLLTTGVLAQDHASPSAATQHPAVAVAPSADKIWSELMAGNRRYAAGQPQPRELVQLRQKLAGSQHPKAMVLTCSDSRVPPELLFDQSLGDLFVVRSAGNIADAIGVGSIEYAAEHLGSTVLIVLGHTSCGAVKTACSGEKMPTPNLQAIVDQIDPAVGRAKRYAQADALVDAAVTENVRQSAKDVLAKSPVLRHELEAGKLTVIQAVYHLDSGEVVRLTDQP